MHFFVMIYSLFAIGPNLYGQSNRYACEAEARPCKVFYHHSAADQSEELLTDVQDFADSSKSISINHSEDNVEGCHLAIHSKHLSVITLKEKFSDVTRLGNFFRKSTATDDSSTLADIWGEVKPYVIPKNHPLKKILDEICLERRILDSYETMEQAGFTIIYRQLNQGIIVAKHPRLQGYLVKAYLDSSARVEWSLWVLRVKGARVIQELLNKYKYNRFMKVPEKLIYPLPEKGRPVANEVTFPKDFILLVEDMDLCSTEASAVKYKEVMSFRRLKALHRVICEGGLSDSHIGNIPFSNDDRIAFVDTEYVLNWPVHLDWLTKHFSLKNQGYWLHLGECRSIGAALPD